jgi:hypothetical protein
MPKATPKAAKSSAKPAAKPAAPAKKAVVKTVKKPTAAPTARAAAPAVKTPAAKKAFTVISAQIDVGFGNTLYLRGEGPGLSWDVGVALESVADDTWSISLPSNGKPVVFKFLINDLSWSVGSDYVVDSGAKVVLVPTF